MEEHGKRHRVPRVGSRRRGVEGRRRPRVEEPDTVPEPEKEREEDDAKVEAEPSVDKEKEPETEEKNENEATPASRRKRRMARRRKEVIEADTAPSVLESQKEEVRQRLLVETQEDEEESEEEGEEDEAEEEEEVEDHLERPYKSGMKLEVVDSAKALISNHRNIFTPSWNEDAFEAVSRDSEAKAQIINELSGVVDEESGELKSDVDEFRKISEGMKQLSESYQDVNSKMKSDGVFVQPIPHHAKKNIPLLKQRLLYDCPEMKKFFGERNELIIEENPLTTQIHRPTFWYDEEGKVTCDLETGNQAISSARVETTDAFQLDVDIRDVTFDDHQLFLKQNSLGAEIIKLHERYEERRRIDLESVNRVKLQSLRASYENLKENSERMSLSVAERHIRLKQLRNELSRTRSQRDAEIGKDAQISRRILQLWKELKTLQKKENLIVTPVRMKFKKVAVKNVEDLLAREEVEFDQQVEEFEDGQIAEFEEQLSLFKKRVEMMRRQDRPEEEIESLEAPKRKNYDQSQVRAQFANTKRKLRGRNIEDDHIVPILYRVALSTEEALQKANAVEELQRRRMLEKKKYYCRLVVNEQVISRTKSQQMNANFQVSFSEIVSVHLHKWPDSVCVQLWESGLIDMSIASVYCTAPGVEGGGEIRSPADSLHFSSSTPVQSEIEGQTCMKYISGVLKARLSWAGMHGGPPSAPQRPIKSQDAYAASVVKRAFGTLSELKEWMISGDVDPNDPKNNKVFALLASSNEGDVISSGFSVSSASKEHLLTDPRRGERVHILRLRDERGMKFTVPLDEDSIDVRQFEKMIESDKDYGIDSDFVKSVREHSIAKRSLQVQRFRTADILREPKFPSFVRIKEILREFFAERRKLRPRRAVREVPVKRPEKAFVLVQVGRGYGFPQRKDFEEVDAMHHPSGRRGRRQPGMKGLTEEKKEDDEEFDENEDDLVTSVHPFVEVTFQGRRKRTTGSVGTRPLFNETVQMEIKASSFEPEVLHMITDDIRINIFDEVTVDLVKDDRASDVVFQRVEKRWLGSLTIPFSTIYANKRVEGTFRIQTPIVNIGYQSEEELKEEEGLSGTKLSLFVTLDPPLEYFEEEVDQPPSIEDDGLVKYSNRWCQTLTSSFPGRTIRCLASDVKGHSVFLCRYVRPQPPPKETRDSLQMVVRFVSMIPFLEDVVSFYHRTDVWSTTQQFLNLRAGDWEEHAILLCNYFLFMNNPAWVVLGKGVPEGDTVYVLTKHHEDYYLWNAATGESFSVKDRLVPLRSIGMAFNAENMWANIQSSDFPGSMNFDFCHPREWKPFFSSGRPAPDLLSVQRAEPEYSVTPTLMRDELEQDISEAVMSAIEKWRSTKHQTTRWHRHISKKLGSLLPSFEKDRHGIPLSEADHIADLSSIRSGYIMYGFPINVPYSDKETIIDAVFSTAIHSSGAKTVEFALGVYVHCFPNKIASVWLYPAALASRR